MKTAFGRSAVGATALAALLALAACGDGGIEDTEMPQQGDASVEINRQGMEGADPAAQAEGVAHDTSSAGAASQEDPDAQLAAAVRAALTTHPEFGAAKVDVHSDDGVVTLRGTAPDPAARERAADIARTVEGVQSVENELTLG